MRKLAYAGSGRIVDADTRNLVSPKRIVFEYNLMAESVAKSSPKPFVCPWSPAPQLSDGHGAEDS